MHSKCSYSVLLKCLAVKTCSNTNCLYLPYNNCHVFPDTRSYVAYSTEAHLYTFNLYRVVLNQNYFMTVVELRLITEIEYV